MFGVHKCSSGQNDLSWYQTASPNRRTIWNKLGLGRGWLSWFPPFRYFPNFSTSPKYVLAIEYHVHSWHVSSPLSCGNTCQRWIWFKERNRHFCEIENFAYGEIDEQSFSNPHLWSSANFLSAHLTYRYSVNITESQQTRRHMSSGDKKSRIPIFTLGGTMQNVACGTPRHNVGFL